MFDEMTKWHDLVVNLWSVEKLGLQQIIRILKENGYEKCGNDVRKYLRHLGIYENSKWRKSLVSYICIKCEAQFTTSFNGKRRFPYCKTCVPDLTAKNRLKDHGLTQPQFDALLVLQKNVCAICKKIASSNNKFVVDHCHQTGKIRGVLCFRCNLNLAVIENKEFLKSAISYLEQEEEVTVISGEEESQ